MDLQTFIRGGYTRLNEHRRSLTGCRAYWTGCFFEKRGGEVEFEDFLGDDTGAIKGVVEPEVGGQGVMGDGGNDTVFEEVAGSEA